MKTLSKIIFGLVVAIISVVYSRSLLEDLGVLGLLVAFAFGIHKLGEEIPKQ